VSALITASGPRARHRRARRSRPPKFSARPVRSTGRA
jgi:hypothetical protein